MAFEQFIAENPELAGMFVGGALAGVGIFVALLFVAIFYVYHAIAWSTIAKKLKHPYPWLAWIPFGGTALRLQLGGFHWALTFLYLVPVLGWLALFVLNIIAVWKAFERRSYPGWFSLSMIIPQVGGILYLIAIGFVAWKDK